MPDRSAKIVMLTLFGRRPKTPPHKQTYANNAGTGMTACVRSCPVLQWFVLASQSVAGLDITLYSALIFVVVVPTGAPYNCGG